MASVNDTLAARGSTYGEFVTQAKLTQAIKRIVRDSPNRDKLSDLQYEALDMIASKIARILNGDANHVDSWHDISGYATLAENDIVPQVNPVLPAAPAPFAPVASIPEAVKAPFLAPVVETKEVTLLDEVHEDDKELPSTSPLPGGPVR